MNTQPKDWHIHVSIANQTMEVFYKHELIKTYRISTAKKGCGEVYGSEQTPRGWHIIRAKIGKDLPLNTVFIKRRPTGEIFTPEWGKQYHERDWITTRILWLSGLELGKNRLGNVDSMQRKIYIHGTNAVEELGTPTSKGCIRMDNADIIELFEMVPTYTKVLIS